jgi:hypothetical protein
VSVFETLFQHQRDRKVNEMIRTTLPVRNFPCQTLKISKVSIVVMGSQRYALWAASPRPANRQGWPLATDSLKFHPGPPCHTLLRPADETPVLGVARPQGGHPVAVFCRFRHPPPYACDDCSHCLTMNLLGLTVLISRPLIYFILRL